MMLHQVYHRQIRLDFDVLLIQRVVTVLGMDGYGKCDATELWVTWVDVGVELVMLVRGICSGRGAGGWLHKPGKWPMRLASLE